MQKLESPKIRYHDTAVFCGTCDGCGRPIYPHEGCSTAYYTDAGENISSLQAQNLRGDQFTHKVFCTGCI